MGLYLDDGTVLTRDPLTGAIVHLREDQMPEHFHKMQGMLEEEEKHIKTEGKPVSKTKPTKKKK
ncbi:MAG: hypothetical protein A2675_04100 [Candidatus Yonathbacteria bacterium RIFCSPHIGHO2_01_FULL_51_10]|uniref:Uncharacterized protein n=1 Tax=Candidatus Yonathbacteria bacterium RIFCSPHIGHO2_01_FULL_51_10 TaxID=1802723 RepID=A0A1G2S3V2_9BACT|nr:MAG: hypothetical protein A2675_04100 [Candidatus Yonathbacteria bacterium RIFCSPHIGHO2_01_FULL_51_10]